jgi:transposase
VSHPAACPLSPHDKPGVGQCAKALSFEETIRGWIAAEVDLTLAEWVERLAGLGVTLKIPALWHQLNKWGLREILNKLIFRRNKKCNFLIFKGSFFRGNDESWLVQCFLKFIEETGMTTQMTRRYGRSPKGKRCVASVPQGHRKTTPFIAALGCEAISAPLVMDGAMNGQTFKAYVEQFLCSTLRPGDVVIADNLSCHKVVGIKEAIEAVGAHIFYLPPYSPDFNPIEKVFSKLKTLLCGLAPRTKDSLWTNVGSLIDSFSSQECKNDFTSCGYVIK